MEVVLLVLRGGNLRNVSQLSLPLRIGGVGQRVTPNAVALFSKDIGIETNPIVTVSVIRRILVCCAFGEVAVGIVIPNRNFYCANVFAEGDVGDFHLKIVGIPAKVKYEGEAFSVDAIDTCKLE